MDLWHLPGAHHPGSGGGPEASSNGCQTHYERWFDLWMFSAGLVIIIGLGIALPNQAGWAVFWLAVTPVIATCNLLHSKHHAQQLQAGCAADVEAAAGPGAHGSNKPVKAPCCSGQAWRNCCAGFGSFLAWSSPFWLAVLAFFLALQAAWLAADKHAFPPLGQMVEVPMEMQDGTTTPARLHVFCTGPRTPGLSSFILEGGGGSPGVSMAGIADALAAGGRRACWYDRLGYGWSDDAIKPATPMRSTRALHALLATPGLAYPPFILVGHSVGGQLALLFAAAYPDLVSGVALLDSYSDVAISRNMLPDASVDELGNRPIQAANGSTVSLPDTTAFDRAVLGALDLLRVVTPLGWGRFITNSGKSGKYGPVSAALYGNNKEWHAQWVEVLSWVDGTGLSTSDQLTLLSDRVVWWGAGWPDLGSKPVLLLPAEGTLRSALPEGCAADFASNASCQAAVRGAKEWCRDSAKGQRRGRRCVSDMVYPDLYLAYLDSLSSNVTLVVVPGGHGYPTDTPQVAADELLLKFGGV